MTDVGEIIKSGAFDKLADIMHKLAGPMADQVGLLLGEKVMEYRAKNWVSVVNRTRKILTEAHLLPRAVPPRLFLPILEASSVEGDETLQDQWAGLLASASEESDSLSPSFVETLKQLTPADAKALNEHYDLGKFQRNNKKFGEGYVLPFDGPSGLSRVELETFERLGLIGREYHLLPHNSGAFLQSFLRAAGEVAVMPLPGNEGNAPQLTYEYKFTEYGIRFMAACRGPKKGVTP
jgi:hypothetical protein